jgi:hypothetical protein
MRVPGWLKLAAAVWAAAAVIAIAVAAHGAPPPNADPALRPWFQSLVAPSGIHCCGPDTDCRTTAARIEGDHWQALLDPAIYPQAGDLVKTPTWIDIPAAAVLQRDDNPTGEAVMCWHRFGYVSEEGLSSAVLCFVRPEEA